MLRTKFQDTLKDAMRSGDAAAVGTMRLIIAAMKDRDIAARSKGQYNGVPDDEILSMLQGMIKQRNESADMYDKGGRPELSEKERSEIKVIERFLPKQLNEKEVTEAIKSGIAAVGAAGIKDMGKVIGELKSKYAGQMDFAKVSGLVKEQLAKLS